MQPGERDERVEEKERSAEIPADSAPESTRDRMRNQTGDRDEAADERPRGGSDFDPTSRGDESGEVM